MADFLTLRNLNMFFHMFFFGSSMVAKRGIYKINLGLSGVGRIAMNTTANPALQRTESALRV